MTNYHWTNLSLRVLGIVALLQAIEMLGQGAAGYAIEHMKANRSLTGPNIIIVVTPALMSLFIAASLLFAGGKLAQILERSASQQRGSLKGEVPQSAFRIALTCLGLLGVIWSIPRVSGILVLLALEQGHTSADFGVQLRRQLPALIGSLLQLFISVLLMNKARIVTRLVDEN